MTDEAIVQILKAINDFREEFRDEKIKNEKRWEENEKRWEQNERNRKRDRDEIKDILWSFQTSVEENEKRIDNIEELCPKCKVKII